MNGWTGKILALDLTKQHHRVITPPEALYHRFVGGKGLAGHYLREQMGLAWDDPLMPLLFFAGPLVGTKAPTSGRMTVMSRSPLTGTVGDTSVGGGLGTQLKRAGWDGVIVTGRAADWTGVEIDNGTVRFCDARPLIDQPTSQVMDALAGRGSVALIGPAAHHGVRFASVMVDRHFAAARNGLGLVFAAKRLKYLAVKGSGKVTVSDQDLLSKAREEIFRLVAASPVLLGEYGIANLGTPALLDLMDARHMMPTDNFRRTHFDGAKKVNAHTLKTTYHPKRTGCRGCHILCKKKTPGGDPLPEFETLSHFSALIENDDPHTAFEANKLCNELGLDTVSAASTLACYREITGTRLDGTAVLKLLTQIGRAEGIGAQLAEGSARYAARAGRPELSMSVKGQELPAYDPRGAYGMALAYATSTRGGCHLRAYPISHEILRKPVATDRFSFSGKARIIKIAEDLNAVVDSLTACKFVFFASSLEEYAKAYTGVTGVTTTANDLSRIGERIYYQERMMNAEVGFTARDDDLPPRFFEEPGTASHGFPVPPIDRAEFDATKQAYYRVRGLDHNGAPLEEQALALGLTWKR